VVSLAGLTSIINPKNSNNSEKKLAETEQKKKDDLSDLELDMLFDEPLESSEVMGSKSSSPSISKDVDLNDFDIKPSDFN